MKITKRFPSQILYLAFFTFALVQFLYLAFDDGNKVWRHFFTGAFALFIGMVIWGATNQK